MTVIYHGWLVGVPINNPASVTAWASATHGGHGAALYGASAVLPVMERIRLLLQVTHLTPVVTGTAAKQLFASNLGPFLAAIRAIIGCLQTGSISIGLDLDLGGSGPLLVDVPGATPSHLIVALGKDRKAYLVNRDNLGGITAPVASATVANSSIIQAAATYGPSKTPTLLSEPKQQRFRLFALLQRIRPPLPRGWSVNRDRGGCGSPFVTSTDGTNNMIVWVVGTEDHIHWGGPAVARL